MARVDEEWVRQQLDRAKMRVAPGQAILSLLEAWNDLPTLTAEDEKLVAESFARLALGHALVPDDGRPIRWVQLQPGTIVIGEEVRVKLDAFTGELGQIHNGREGVVVGARYGDVFINSTDDRTPVLNGVNYSPYHLERKTR